MGRKNQSWNERQQALRQALGRPAEHAQALELFLQQHAWLHASQLTQAAEPTLDDELWQGLTEPIFRRIPSGGEHSIAWCLWHLARIEDLTMNLLLAGKAQLFLSENWQAALKTGVQETGNALDSAAMARLSAEVDMQALRAYRLEVGRRTRQNVAELSPLDLKQPVSPVRLQQALDEGAVAKEAYGLIEYWGGLTGAGLLLMPPTRHLLVHLNEALRLKKKK